MSNIMQAMWLEMLKARRSKMPLLTVLGFSLAPFAGGFFMIVMKDPDLARDMGMISAKAQVFAGSADWQTYLGLLAQAIAIGGIMLFGLLGSWVFGREYSDHTVKDLLALPTARSTIVLAKFVVIILWSMATGLKYQGIAEQLIVSLNTVRSHMKNIYGKLGVHSRMQAIGKAHELNLL